MTYGRVMLVFLLLTGFIFDSCRKEEATVIMVENGSWKVTYFSDNGNDETNDFASYSFHFEKKGRALASSSAGTTYGTWSAGYDDDKRLKFTLIFGPSPLSKLNEDWEVVSEEAKIVQLRHLSGGSGGGDYLTFRKQ